MTGTTTPRVAPQRPRVPNWTGRKEMMMQIPGFTAHLSLHSPNATRVYRALSALCRAMPNMVEPAGEACYGCHCKFRCSGIGIAQSCELGCSKNCLYCEDMGGGVIRCELLSRPCKPAFYPTRTTGARGTTGGT